jgi:hypothetical protein
MTFAHVEGPRHLVRRLPAVLATELAKQGDPQILGGVGFSAAESCHTNRAVISSDTDSLKNSLSLRGVFGQKSGGEQIVGLATAHGLLEAEDALIAPSHQPVEDLAQQDAHALGDMCLIKKGASIEVRQIGNLSDLSERPRAKTDCRGLASLDKGGA